MIRRSKILVKTLRNEGLDKFLDIVAWNVPRWLFYYNHAVLVRSDSPAWLPKAHPGYDIRFLTSDDEHLLDISNLSGKVAMERLKNGDKAVIAVKDNEVLAITWAATGGKFLKLNGAIVDTGPQGCFFYGSYTSAKARLQGLFSTVRNCLQQYFVALGRSINWGTISANDQEWLSTVMKRNYTKAGETFYIKILFINICYYKSWPFPTSKLHVFFKIPPDRLTWV